MTAPMTARPRLITFRSRRVQIVAALAALALVLRVLMPAHGLAGAPEPSDRNLVPICTASGVVWVSLDGDVPAGAPDQPSAQACHFCATHTQTCDVSRAAAPAVEIRYASGVEYPSSGDVRGRIASGGSRAIRAPPA